MDVEMLGQLSYRPVTLDGGKRHLRLEGRRMVPARSSVHGLSCARRLSPVSGRNSTYRSVQICESGSDAAKKATYEHIRRGANWEQFNRNLADLLEYRAANDKKNWHFNLTMTIMKSNLHEIVDCIKWAGSLGLGFGCGPMTGDYGPVKNARTYLEENIFRYPHIGVSQAEAISVFEQALEAADCIPLEYREGAKNNISGMIEFAKSTKPVVISEPDVEKLRALPDAELSQALCSIVTTGTAPWNLKPPKAAWWMKRARNARNIIRAAVRQA
jgi:hypothetical protein